MHHTPEVSHSLGVGQHMVSLHSECNQLGRLHGCSLKQEETSAKA